MAKTKEQKQQLKKFYEDIISKSEAIFLVDATGVSATQMTDIRKKLFGTHSRFHILKNTIFRMASEESGKPVTDEEMKGQTGSFFIIGSIDKVAKIIKDFTKQFELLQPKIGFLGNNQISGAQITQIAELPGKDQLRAQVAGMLTSQVSRFENLLTAPLTNFCRAIKAYSESKQSQNSE